MSHEFRPGKCEAPNRATLMPALVTGIQPPRVGAVNDSLLFVGESLAPKDLGALDACDEHRHEGAQRNALLEMKRASHTNLQLIGASHSST